MEKLLALLISLVLVLIWRVDGGTIESICQKKNCPVFEVLDSFQVGVELRKYNASNWIATKVNDPSFQGFTSAHNELSAYQKEAGKTIDLDTWPVLINVTADGSIWLTWFVASTLKKIEGNYPKIKLIRRPESMVFVTSFDGLPSKEAATARAEELWKTVYDKSDKAHNYAGASFNSYFDIEHHNEIWIDAVDAAEC